MFIFQDEESGFRACESLDESVHGDAVVTQAIQTLPSHVSIHVHVFAYVGDLKVVEQSRVLVFFGSELNQHSLLLLRLDGRRLARLIGAQCFKQDAFDFVDNVRVHLHLLE